MRPPPPPRRASSRPSTILSVSLQGLRAPTRNPSTCQPVGPVVGSVPILAAGHPVAAEVPCAPAADHPRARDCRESPRTLTASAICVAQWTAVASAEPGRLRSLDPCSMPWRQGASGDQVARPGSRPAGSRNGSVRCPREKGRAARGRSALHPSMQAHSRTRYRRSRVQSSRTTCSGRHSDKRCHDGTSRPKRRTGSPTCWPRAGGTHDRARASTVRCGSSRRTIRYAISRKSWEHSTTVLGNTCGSVSCRLGTRS